MLAPTGASIGNNWTCNEWGFYYKDGNVTKIGQHSFVDMRYMQFFFGEQNVMAPDHKWHCCFGL